MTEQDEAYYKTQVREMRRCAVALYLEVVTTSIADDISDKLKRGADSIEALVMPQVSQRIPSGPEVARMDPIDRLGIAIKRIELLRSALLECKHGAEYPDDLGDRINEALSATDGQS